MDNYTMQPIEEKIYLTLVLNHYDGIAVDDFLVLEKESNNSYDDEAIVMSDAEFDFDELKKNDTTAEPQQIKLCSNFEKYHCRDVYVANSVNTVARGTYSAGRIYDKFNKYLVVKVKFIMKNSAIAQVIGELNDFENEKV